jgi:DNA-binding HxlR family transcriptional regulator
VRQKEVAGGQEEEHNEEEQNCKIINSMWEVIGRRWALLILRNLHTKEAVRFNELKRLMSDISSTVLATRLLEMEREGLISKKIYPEIPPSRIPLEC